MDGGGVAEFRWRIDPLELSRTSNDYECAKLRSPWFDAGNLKLRLHVHKNRSSDGTECLGLWIKAREAAKLIGDKEQQVIGYNGSRRPVTIATSTQRRRKLISKDSLTGLYEGLHYRVHVVMRDDNDHIGSSLCDSWWPIVHMHEIRGTNGFARLDRIAHFAGLNFLLQVQAPGSTQALERPVPLLASAIPNAQVIFGRHARLCNLVVLRRSQMVVQAIEANVLDLRSLFPRSAQFADELMQKVLAGFVAVVNDARQQALVNLELEELVVLAMIMSALGLRAFLEIVVERLVRILDLSVHSAVQWMAIALYRRYSIDADSAPRYHCVDALLWREVVVALSTTPPERKHQRATIEAIFAKGVELYPEIFLSFVERRGPRAKADLNNLLRVLNKEEGSLTASLESLLSKRSRRSIFVTLLVRTSFAVWLRPFAMDVFATLYSKGLTRASVLITGTATAPPPALDKCGLVLHPYIA